MFKQTQRSRLTLSRAYESCLASPVNTLFPTIVSGFYVTDEVFPCLVFSGPHRTKAHKSSNGKKSAPRKLVLARSMFKFQMKVTKECCFGICWGKWRRFVHGLDQLWRAENWPKLVPSLGWSPTPEAQNGALSRCQGGAPHFKWQGWLNGGNNQNPKKSLQIVLNSPKNPYLNQAARINTCQNFPTPKNSRNLKFQTPQKSFDHPCRLKSGVTPMGFPLPILLLTNIRCQWLNRELKNHNEVHDDEVC